MHLTERNNHAARLIMANRYRESYDELRLGLHEEATRLRSSERSVPEIPASTNRLIVRAIGNINSDADDLLFPSPLLVVSSSIQNDNDIDYVRCCCATVIFNMGLTCHLFAHRNPLPSQAREQIFRQAQVLHQQAREMGQHLAMPVLHLALLCNLLELSFEQVDIEMASIWNALFTQWMCVSQVGHVQDSISI